MDTTDADSCNYENGDSDVEDNSSDKEESRKDSQDWTDNDFWWWKYIVFSSGRKTGSLYPAPILVDVEVKQTS